jgi:hypothetical protein
MKSATFGSWRNAFVISACSIVVTAGTALAFPVQAQDESSHHLQCLCNSGTCDDWALSRWCCKVDNGDNSVYDCGCYDLTPCP